MQDSKGPEWDAKKATAKYRHLDRHTKGFD